MRSATFVLAIVFLAPLSVPAQNMRSAVSVTGSDAATCAVADPCRSFASALSKTSLGGEVIVLSSGGYGSFNVRQAVSVISPPGIYAAVSPAAFNIGVDISTPAGQSVVLRGLYLNGSLTTFPGIYVSSPGTILYVENTVIANFSSDGAEGVRNSDGDVRITDSEIRNNSLGVLLTHDNSSARSRAVIDHVRFEGNTNAVALDNLSDATITRSLFASNFRGVSIDGAGQVDGRVVVKHCVFAQNQVGIFAISSAADVRVSSSTITQSTQFALDIQQGAQVTTAGNNVVIDNAANETFSGPFALK